MPGFRIEYTHLLGTSRNWRREGIFRSSDAYGNPGYEASDPGASMTWCPC